MLGRNQGFGTGKMEREESMSSFPDPNDYPTHEDGEVWIPLFGKLYKRIIYGKEGLGSEGTRKRRMKYFPGNSHVRVLLFLNHFVLFFLVGIGMALCYHYFFSSKIWSAFLLAWIVIFSASSVDPLRSDSSDMAAFFLIRKDYIVIYYLSDSSEFPHSTIQVLRINEIAGLFIFGIHPKGWELEGTSRSKDIPDVLFEILLKDGTHILMPREGRGLPGQTALKLFRVLKKRTEELGIPFNYSSNLYYLEKVKNYNDLTREKTELGQTLLEKELEHQYHSLDIVEQAMGWYEHEGNYKRMREIGDRFLRDHMGPVILTEQEKKFFQKYLFSLIMLEEYERAENIYKKYEDEAPPFRDMVFFYVISLFGQKKEDEAQKIIQKYWPDEFESGEIEQLLQGIDNGKN